MWPHEGMDTSGWILMALAVVVLWSLVIVAVAALYPSDCRDHDHRCASGRDPVDQGVEEPLPRAAGSADPHHPSRTP